MVGVDLVAGVEVVEEEVEVDQVCFRSHTAHPNGARGVGQAASERGGLPHLPRPSPLPRRPHGSEHSRTAVKSFGSDMSLCQNSDELAEFVGIRTKLGSRSECSTTVRQLSATFGRRRSSQGSPAPIFGTCGEQLRTPLTLEATCETTAAPSVSHGCFLLSELPTRSSRGLPKEVSSTGMLGQILFGQSS